MALLGKCRICAAVAPTELRLIRFAAPKPGKPFASLEVCIDRTACRDRFEATGKPWPVRDPQPSFSPAAATTGGR